LHSARGGVSVGGDDDNTVWPVDDAEETDGERSDRGKTLLEDVELASEPVPGSVCTRFSVPTLDTDESDWRLRGESGKRTWAWLFSCDEQAGDGECDADNYKVDDGVCSGDEPRLGACERARGWRLGSTLHSADRARFCWRAGARMYALVVGGELAGNCEGAARTCPFGGLSELV